MWKKIGIASFISFLFFFGVPFSGRAQSAEPGLLLEKMCHHFKDFDRYLTGTVREKIILSRYYSPYLQQIAPEKREKTGFLIFIKFLQECDAYARYFNRTYLYPKLTKTDTVPKREITAKQVKEFTHIKNFYYKDHNNKIVHVRIRKGIWVNSYPGPNYTKNKVFWGKENNFTLKFLDSTDPIRRSIQQQNRVRHFKIIKKEKGYYLIATQPSKKRPVYTFKLFVE